MKKRIYGLAVCLLPISSPGNAADIPVFKASPAPQWNWTACYLGVHAGGGGAATRQSASTPAYVVDNTTYQFGFPGGIADSGSTGGASFLGGGQVGCRYETPQHLVFGLEGDFSGTSLRLNHTLGAGNSAPFLAGDTFTTRTDWQSSVRANIGYGWGRWLAYVTGGVAVAQMSVDGNYVGGNGGGPVTFLPASGSDSKTLVGLTVGAGAAYAIDNHWSIGAEYRYSNYGSQTFHLGTIRSDSADPENRAVLGVTGRANLQTHQIMAKLNYGFDPFRTPLAERPLQSFASAAPVSDVRRFYGGVDYLLWQVKGAPLSVPLVSSGPVATTHHGLLGAPENGADSTILYGAPLEPAKGGNDTQNFSLFSGARVTGGYWLDDARRFAVEASGFALQTRSAGFAARSDQTGNPILGFPVYNNIPYSIGPMTIFAGEDSLPTSLPEDPDRARTNGLIVGGLSVTNKLKFWGVEASGVVNIYRSSWWELSGMVGFRHLNLSEELYLTGDIQGLSGPYTDMSGVVWDQFQTKNRFYGALLGMRNRFLSGPWSLDLATSVALGASKQTISISGGFTAVNFGPTSGPEGVFAQPANEGTYSSTKFAFVPEVQVKVGYNITPAITFTVGYNFIYYSNVVRPGDQINRELPKGQTFEQAQAPTSTTSPARLYNTTDFYAQGLTVGVTARF